jgi:hypothetical protein
MWQVNLTAWGVGGGGCLAQTGTPKQAPGTPKMTDFGAECVAGYEPVDPRVVFPILVLG